MNHLVYLTFHDERVVNPDASKSRYSDGPRRKTEEYCLPWNFHALVFLDLSWDIQLDVFEFLRWYPRMIWRSVESKEIPHDAPENSDRSSCIEHGAPSVRCDDETAKWVGETDTDRESLERTHEPRSFCWWDPRRNDRVHGRPSQTRSKALHRPNKN